MKKIFLFVLAVLLVPIVQAAPIQINDPGTGGERPIVLDEGNLACIFWPATNQLSMNCVDPSTGTRKTSDIRVGDLVKNIDGDYLNGKFVVVGERGDDLKVFLVDKNGQGTNFDISRLGLQSNPRISINPDDSQIGIVWEETSSNQTDIYFQIFDFNGLAIVGEIQITNSTTNETNPDISYDNIRKRFRIVYQNLAGLLYFSILEKNGSVFLNNTILSNTARISGKLKTSGEYDLFTIYSDSRQGLGTDIFSSQFSSDGLVLGDVSAASDPALDEKTPDISFNIQSRFTGQSELGIAFEGTGNIFFTRLFFSGATGNKIDLGTGSNPSITYLNQTGLYFVAFQNGNNIQGVLLREDGTQVSAHTLVALPAGFEIYDLNKNKLNVGFQSFGDVPVLIKHPTLGYIAGLTLKLQDTNIDLSTAKLEISGEGKVYLDLSTIVGISNTQVYLKNTNSGSGFIICPEASSANQTTESCTGQRTPTIPSTIPINQRQIDISLVVLDGQSYYLASGLANAGLSLSSKEKTKLDLFDETRISQRLPNEETKFFAFYTDNNVPVSNANCEIEFSTDPVGGPKKSQMVFDQKSKLYTKSAKFSSEGEFTFSVSCSSGVESLNTSSKFKIGKQNLVNTAPVITKLSPTQGSEIDQSTAKLECSATAIGLSTIKIRFGKPLADVKEEVFFRQEKNATVEYLATVEDDNSWECIVTDVNGNQTSSTPISFKKSQTNTGICKEKWECSGWSTCSNGKQTKTCTDKNNCGTEKNKPLTQIECIEQPQKGFDFGSLLLPLIIIIVVLIAALGGYIFWKNRKKLTEKASSTDDENI